MKRIESLFKIAGMKFEFSNLEIRFHKCQISLIVIKTVKCIRSISLFVRLSMIESILGLPKKLRSRRSNH